MAMMYARNSRSSTISKKDSSKDERNSAQHDKTYKNKTSEEPNSVENIETEESGKYNFQESIRVSSEQSSYEHDKMKDSFGEEHTNTIYSDLLEIDSDDGPKESIRRFYTEEPERKEIVVKTLIRSKKKEVLFKENVHHEEMEEVEEECKEDEDEYIWIEEEVDEEIEVETNEEDAEQVDEEYSEEACEEEEEHALYGIDEEFHEIPEEEIEEELETEIPTIEDVGTEEFIIEGDVPEETVDEEEDELQEEGKIEIQHKAKAKFKTIKVKRMVRKRKKSVIEMLQKLTTTQEDYEALKQEKIEKQRREEEHRKEHDETIELMKNLISEIMNQKRKNNTLSKMIIDYHKRKFENVHELDPPPEDIKQKYYKRLKLVNDYKKAIVIERERILNDLNTMQEELKVTTEDYEKEKNELHKWTTEVGKCAITGLTGHALEESAVSHLVQRHATVLSQLSKERLKLLTLQSKCSKQEAKLKNLSWFEGNVSLIDYEQLCVDNQVFSDKIDERDIELANLRKKVLVIIHTQAHVHEKSDAIQDSIATSNYVDYLVNNNLNEFRESVGLLKKTRDIIRQETHELRKRSGLLTRPKLGRDYATCVSKIHKGQSKLNDLLNTNKKQQVIIERIRKEIAQISAFNEIE